MNSGMMNDQKFSPFWMEMTVEGMSIRLVKKRTIPRISMTRLSFLGIRSYLLLMVVLIEMYTIVPHSPDGIIIINGYYWTL